MYSFPTLHELFPRLSVECALGIRTHSVLQHALPSDIKQTCDERYDMGVESSRIPGAKDPRRSISLRTCQKRLDLGQE